MVFHVENYQVRWKNFRGFKDTDWITIRPLTILIGPNNAGKTSVFAPLLIMAQTVRSPDGVTPLITTGNLINAGAPYNLANNNQSKPIYFGFKFHLHIEDSTKRSLGKEPPGVLEITLTPDKPNRALLLKEYKLSDAKQRLLLTKTRTSDAKYNFRSPLLHRLKPSERKAIRYTPPVNFHFSANATINVLRKMDERSNFAYSKDFSHYLSMLGFQFADVSRVLRSLTYIGPMREKLARYYQVSGETPESVGVSGAQMANMIWHIRSTETKHALNSWIRRFEFGKSLKILKSSTEDIFSLAFVLNKKKLALRNIADSGFGVSQVLPLIVQAVTAGKETLTIAEQPEIHLNPRLQTTLADLFVEMANTDRRVIVETHSEHLLLRLRTLIAKKAITPNQVAVYFVEKEEDLSKIREIKISTNGAIDAADWPKGFFADSLKEAFALATEQSRSKLVQV